MVDVVTRLVIERPRAEVAVYAADPSNAPEWYVNIDSAQWRSEPVLREGAEVAFSARFLGRTLSYVYRIEEFVPLERLVMQTAEGPFPMRTTYTWEDSGPNATLMVLRNNGEPKGFSRLAAPLVERSMRKANTADLKNLKNLLESR